MFSEGFRFGSVDLSTELLPNSPPDLGVRSVPPERDRLRSYYAQYHSSCCLVLLVCY
jgi:hypothetical protein